MEIEINKQYFIALKLYDRTLNHFNIYPVKIKLATINEIYIKRTSFMGTIQDECSYSIKENFDMTDGLITPDRIFNSKEKALEFKKQYYTDRFLNKTLGVINDAIQYENGRYRTNRKTLNKLPRGWKPHNICAYQRANWFRD